MFFKKASWKITVILPYTNFFKPYCHNYNINRVVKGSSKDRPSTPITFKTILSDSYTFQLN